MGNDCVEVKKKYEFDNINTMYCSAFGMMQGILTNVCCFVINIKMGEIIFLNKFKKNLILAKLKYTI
jgi:hypothetical protein